MAVYKPKLKTNTGVEEVKLPTASIEGLDEQLANITTIQAAIQNIPTIEWDPSTGTLNIN